MNVLVCNVGSTSLKFKLFDMPGDTVLAEGKVERVGSTDAILHYTNRTTGHAIRLDGQTTFPVDWTAQLGTLEPGTYNFRFFVYRHRPGELAELYDRQTFKVQITIAEE